MKITINLSEVKVKALKAYLKEVSHDIKPKITKKEIEMEVRGMVDGYMQSGALGDHYQAELDKGLSNA